MAINIDQREQERIKQQVSRVHWKKVNKDKKLLLKVILRLLRNKKILKQAKKKVRKKVLCLASKIKEKGELTLVEELKLLFSKCVS